MQLDANSASTALPAPPPASDDDYQFVVLRQNWIDLELGYTAAEALPRLKAAGAGGSLLVLNVATIDQYAWGQQTITLTKAGTQALVHAVAGEGTGRAPFKALTELKQSLGWGNALERALYIKGFVVNVRSEALYAGIFLDAPSQMAIDFPVARVSIRKGQAGISLLPVHIPFVTVDPVAEAGTVNELSIVQEAQEDARALDQKDKGFSHWLGQLATTETAKTFRQLMRDGRIRHIFERAGKLRA